MIGLEDHVGDIVGKAMRGLGISAGDLCARAGIGRGALEALLGGVGDEGVLSRVASPLGLNAGALLRIGRGEVHPGVSFDEPGFAMCVTSCGDMCVNAYLAWDTSSGRGFAFDTGADAGPLLARCRSEGVRLEGILLTHGHGDHVAGLERLRREGGAEAWVGRGEGVRGARVFDAGAEFVAGRLRVGSRRTSGHSAGGMTYVVSGLVRPLAIVGDALFAGSMGGATGAYREALETCRASIFTLPDETVLCPGHGPLTTVGLERLNNPFFAGEAG